MSGHHDAAAGHITDPFVAFAEQAGVEIGVTLVIGGTVVTGHVTPIARYVQWFGEVFHRTALEGGRARLTGTMSPMTPGQAEQIREDWARYLELQGIEPDDVGSVSFSRFALRDAQIRSGPLQQWTTLPYLLVSSAHVQAATVGIQGGSPG